MNQQSIDILRSLEGGYTVALMMDDVETMIRLGRAIVAFKYDVNKDMPGHEELVAWEIN